LKDGTVKFYKSLFLFSLLLSLTTFMVGCGGSTVTFDSDPVMSDPDSDPTLHESNTDITGESTERGGSSDSAKSGEPGKKQ